MKRATDMASQAWTPAQLELLRINYADSRTEDLAIALERTPKAVKLKAMSLGLRKSDVFLATQARFQKGLVPWNKGLPFQARGRSTETVFKTGQLNGRAAQLVMPVGSYRVNGEGYLDRKVSDQPGPQHLRWKPVHRLVWEAANGPVPAGHVVCFLPGRHTTDLEKITPDALELVTRRELMLRNTFHRFGPGVAQLVILRGQLTRQINKKAKEEQ